MCHRKTLNDLFRPLYNMILYTMCFTYKLYSLLQFYLRTTICCWHHRHHGDQEKLGYHYADGLRLKMEEKVGNKINDRSKNKTGNDVYEKLWPNHLLVHRMVFFFKKKVILSLELQIIKLTNFEAPSYNNFRDIMIVPFQCPNLQRAITQKIK